MTGLEKITQEIQQAAQAEADEILKAAKKDAEEILAKNNASVDTRCNAILANAEKAATDTKARTSSSVELQHRQDILQVKQSLIADTLEKAKEAAAHMPKEDYLKLLATLAKETDLVGAAKISVNKKDHDLITPEFLKNFPETLAVSLDENAADIAGGFVLTTENVVVNSSIEALFDRYQDVFTDKILAVLFD